MDTKSRNNNNEIVEIKEEIIKEVKIKEDKSIRNFGYQVKKGEKFPVRRLFSGYLAYLLLFLLISGAVICNLGLKEGKKYGSDFSDSIRYNNLEGMIGELRTYHSILGKYYMEYVRQDFLADVEVTEEEREQYRQKLLYERFEEEMELNQIYEEEIRGSSYKFSDYDNKLRMQQYDYNIDAYTFDKWQSKLMELRNRYNLAIENIDKNIWNEKIQFYKDLKNQVDENKNFSYFITDEINNKTYTNIIFDNQGENQQESLQRYLELDRYYFHVTLDDDLLKDEDENTLDTSFAVNGMSGYIFIPEYIPYDSYSYQTYQKFKNFFSASYVLKIILPLQLVAIVFILIFAFFIGRKEFLTANRFCYGIYQKQPFVMKVIGTIFALWFVAEELMYYYSYNSYSFVFSIPMLLIGAFIFLYINLSVQFAIKTLTHMKNLKNEWEIRYLSKLIQICKVVISTKEVFLIIDFLIFIIGIPLIIMFAGAVAVSTGDGFFFIIFMVMVTILVLPLASLIFLIHNYAKLTFYLKNIVAGEMDEIPESKGFYSKAINYLRDINVGFKKALEETIKSERMKSELITNVSHDLKTPLTAIINYIELLKKSTGQNHETLQYIEVLDKKSARLKILIEDLFEATKLTSGNLKLEYETVNVVALMKQAIGEFSERIDESGIIFRTTYCADAVYVHAEGKKIWRVFENMLDNIIKYSPKESRAYIQIDEDLSNVLITFKNMSVCELDFEPTELFERFKRGDASRTTEGSGLGISIARSIVEIHGGEMKISIDGDLFKVEIEMKKNI